MDVDPHRRAFDKQYDNPHRVEIGTDAACIYDIAPPHPRSSVPILFCPGWMENPQNHKETIYALYRQGRRTVFPDSPHGIEARPRANLPMAQLRHAQALIATLKHQGVDEADAIAHSAGAISLAIAGTASGGPRFRNVVLQSPAGLCGGETAASVAWRGWQESRQETRRQRCTPTERQLIRDYGCRRMYWLSTLARTVAEIKAIANVDIRELLIEMRRRGGRLAVVHGTDDRLFSMERMQRHVDAGLVDGFYSVDGGHQQILLEPSRHASLASEVLLALERRRLGSDAQLHEATARVLNA
jgi:pimeloyl-ACP methyl ester carboxylesterase